MFLNSQAIVVANRMRSRALVYFNAFFWTLFAGQSHNFITLNIEKIEYWYIMDTHNTYKEWFGIMKIYG